MILIVKFPTAVVSLDPCRHSFEFTSEGVGEWFFSLNSNGSDTVFTVSCGDAITSAEDAQRATLSLLGEIALGIQTEMRLPSGELHVKAYDLARGADDTQ